MTAKEKIKGVFSNQDAQVKFMEWFIGIGVVLSTTFSGLSYTRLQEMNEKYIEIKEYGVEIQYEVKEIKKTVDEHSAKIDSLSKRLSILEVTEKDIEKTYQLKHKKND